ncbi:MAG: DUF234 domain-containing protein [Eubacteriales bacterium]|nr:DUF234 domain-containing protein [Eubacteriales bacterium]
MTNLIQSRAAEKEQILSTMATEGFSLITIGGRKGIGKAELLRACLKDYEATFIRIPDLAEAGQRQYWQYYFPDFTDADWGEFFRDLAQRYKAQPGILLLLDFERLLKVAPKIEAALRKAIREEFLNSQLKLIISYNFNSEAEKPKTLARGFYHQTAELNLDLYPLSYRESLAYLPHWSAEDRLYGYSISGGVPAYLEILSTYSNLEAALYAEFLKPEGYLQKLPALKLAESLREPAVYNLLLMAIAQGSERQKDIAETAEIPASSAANYLRVLLELGLIEKAQPYRNPNPRLMRYAVSEPIFRFCFHFLPRLDPLRQRGLYTEAYQLLREKMPAYFQKDFCLIARDYLLDLQKSGDLEGDFDDFAPWWNEDGTTIDLIGSDANLALLAACLWSNEKMTVDNLENLRQKSRLTQRRKNKIYTLFSRSGFTDELVELAENTDDLHLISLFGEA